MGLVKSTERFDFNIDYYINATSSGVYTLGKSQVVANCVPFFTVRAEHFVSYDFQEIFPRVYFDGNNIVAELGTAISNGNNQTFVSVEVVEFDPTYAKVQSGTFDMTGTTDTTVSGVEFDSVDLDKTFLLFSYNYSGVVSRSFQYGAVKGSFSNDSSISFGRYAGTGNINGSWFAVECLNNSFSVSSSDAGIISGSRRGHIIFPESRDHNKSFLINSYKTTNAASQDADYYGVSAHLANPTTATIRRYNTGGGIDASLFRVTLNGKGQSVQRFQDYANNTLATNIYKIDELDNELLTPHIASFFGINHSSDDDADDMPRMFHQACVSGPDLCQTISGTVTSSGTTDPENAFDGDDGTNAVVSAGWNWVQFEFPTTTGINNTTIHNNGVAVTTSFRIDGSNTGAFAGEESILLNHYYTTFEAGDNHYPFENKDDYKYYRFINTASANILTIGKIELQTSTAATIDRVTVNKKRAKSSLLMCELINWKEYDPYVEVKQSSEVTPVLSVEQVQFDYDDRHTSYIELSKNQNPDYCVPFLTSYQETQSIYSHANYLSNVIFTDDGGHTRLTCTRRRDTPVNHTAVSVVEFDPAHVKVQSGSFGIRYSGTSYTVSGTDNLDTFDKDKTFLIFNYNTLQNNTIWGRVLVRGRLPNNDSIIFDRADPSADSEEVSGTWYLVESINDWFDVEQLDFSGGLITEMLALSEPINPYKGIVALSYRTTSNITGNDADYFAAYAYLENPHEVLLRKSSAVSVNYIATIFVVKFNFDKQYPIVYRYLDQSVAAGTGVMTVYYHNVPSYSTDQVTVRTPTYFGISASADDDADDVPRSFNMLTVSEISGDQVTLTSWMGKAAHHQFEFIDWGPRVLPTHHFEGTVEEIDSPVERLVRAHRVDTGEMVGYTTSTSGGIFDVTTTHSGAHYVVCFDDEAGVDYNDLIYGNVIPDAI